MKVSFVVFVSLLKNNEFTEKLLNQWYVSTKLILSDDFNKISLFTVLIKNKSNIRWKCSKVTCTGKATTNLYELILTEKIVGTPRFPLQIWNVRHQTIKNSHRTNNFSEGWNI